MFIFCRQRATDVQEILKQFKFPKPGFISQSAWGTTLKEMLQFSFLWKQKPFVPRKIKSKIVVLKTCQEPNI